MKKITSLVILSATFALTACASSLTEVQAMEKAKEMIAYQETNKLGLKGDESFTLSIDMNAEEKRNYPASKESTSMKGYEKAMYSYNAKASVLRIKMDFKATQDGKTESETVDMYAFVRKNNGKNEVVVASSNSGGKTYAAMDFGSEADAKSYIQEEAFEALMDHDGDEGFSLLGTDVLEEIAKGNFEELAGDTNAKYSFTSKGNGNLTLKVSEHYVEKDEECTEEMNMKATYTWNNYWTSSLHMEMAGSFKYATNKELGEYSGATEYEKTVLDFKLGFTSSVKAPSLAGYTEGRVVE